MSTVLGIEQDVFSDTQSKIESAVLQAFPDLIDRFMEFNGDIEPSLLEHACMRGDPDWHIEIVTGYGTEPDSFHELDSLVRQKRTSPTL
jgi:hypothetical protein